MEADITRLTAYLILLFACGLDLAGRDHSGRQLPRLSVAILIGKILGLRIVAPVSGEAAGLAETVVFIALVAVVGALGVRWIYRRYRKRFSSSNAPVL
jgi:hypothetical protein